MAVQMVLDSNKEGLGGVSCYFSPSAKNCSVKTVISESILSLAVYDKDRSTLK
jgi:hypothetical protein